jgi:uncharacterized protein with von Willebrand factor type A (vWA) domain
VNEPDPAIALLGFARAVAAAGIAVTPDRGRSFLSACAQLGVHDFDHVYWAGRATLAPGPEQVPAFDAAFARWFAGHLVPAGSRPSSHRSGTLVDVAGHRAGDSAGDPAGDPAGDSADDLPALTDPADESAGLPGTASELELLRHRDLASLTPRELAAVARLFAAVLPRSPVRRSPRWRASGHGSYDIRRTLRADLRRGGEPGTLLRRRRATRPRPVVLLIDVSGSMAPYADALLRLAHVWVRSSPASTEAFTVGTRLTRISAPLRSRDPAVALVAAAAQVPDWSGGTRLGEVIRAFLDVWGQRGTARRAVVVVFSDGWERGDAALLGEQMARLRRLAHRVFWVSPHRARPGYVPVQAGISAALPFCDRFLAGHSVQTFVDLAAVVEDA